jgi:hypothetical protein
MLILFLISHRSDSANRFHFPYYQEIRTHAATPNPDAGRSPSPGNSFDKIPIKNLPLQIFDIERYIRKKRPICRGRRNILPIQDILERNTPFAPALFFTGTYVNDTDISLSYAWKSE